MPTLADPDFNAKLFREKARVDERRTLPPQLWEAKCPECGWRTGFIRSASAQTKAHAHAAVKKHDVELYAAIFVATVSKAGQFDPRRSE